MMKKIMAFSAIVLSAQVANAEIGNYNEDFSSFKTSTPVTSSLIYDREIHKQAKIDAPCNGSGISSPDRIDNGYDSDDDENNVSERVNSQTRQAEEIQDNFTKNQPGFGAKAWNFAKSAAYAAYKATYVTYSFIRSFF